MSDPRQPSNDSPASVNDESLSFEAALASVERVAAELEDGHLPLAEAIAKYEQGVGHLKRCYEQLAQAERKIELLTGLDADGNPLTTPFDTDSAALAERAGTRQRKRTRSDA